MELWAFMDLWTQTALVFLVTLLVAFLPGAVEIIFHPDIHPPLRFDHTKP